MVKIYNIKIALDEDADENLLQGIADECISMIDHGSHWSDDYYVNDKGDIFQSIPNEIRKTLGLGNKPHHVGILTITIDGIDQGIPDII